MFAKMKKVCLLAFLLLLLLRIIVLLPAPFMSTQRRRALSHAGLAPQYSGSMPSNGPHSAPRARPRPPLAPLSPVTRRMAPSSPVQARRPSLTNHQNVMATPPPNRQLAERLRLKGSLTDPAQPRRREAFDAVCLSFLMSICVLKFYFLGPSSE